MDVQNKSSDAKRRRSARACTFCQRRKLRCGNEEPRCHNCETYHEHCVYVVGPKKARPSNSRIKALEEENRQLRSRIAELTRVLSGKPASKVPSRPTPQRSEDLGTCEEDDEISCSDSSNGPIQGDSAEFHGPSSIFFDYREKHSVPEDRENGNYGHITLSLIAETEAQRQLENVYLSSDQRDFDGVESRLAESLLRIYWTRVNSFFMLVYRPAFEKSWADGGPYFSKLLLNAMYFSASRYVNGPTEGQTSAKLAEKFRHRFKQLFDASYDRSRITTIQGLLVVSVSLSAVGKDRDLAWHFSGLAFRMLVGLGLHTHNLGKKAENTAMEIETQRRIFWSSYFIDKLQAFYHGRPPNIQEADTMVPLVLHDEYEEGEIWYPLEPAPLNLGIFAQMFCVSNFIHLCTLSKIMNKILNKIYREKSEKQQYEALKASVDQLERELNDWHMSLPVHLQLPSWSIGQDVSALPSPHIYVILIMFHVVKILLHRPFLSYGHLQSFPPDVARASFALCAEAAEHVAIYLDSYNRQSSNTQVYRYLQTCLQVYDMNIETNPAVKKAKSMVERLMDQMGVEIPDSVCSEGASRPAHQSAPNLHGETLPTSSYIQQDFTSQAGLLQGWNKSNYNNVVQSFSKPFSQENCLQAGLSGLASQVNGPMSYGTCQAQSAILNAGSQHNYLDNQFSAPSSNMEDLAFDLFPEELW